MADQTPAPAGAGNPTPTSPPAQCIDPRPRLAYTRYATAGDGDDRIVNPIWYKVLLAMFGIGGVLTLLAILLGGVWLGKSTSAGVSPPTTSMSSVVAPPPSVPVAVVPPAPAPPPQVVVIQVPQASAPPSASTSVRVEIPEPIKVEVARPQPVDCSQYSGAERLSCERWAKIK